MPDRRIYLAVLALVVFASGCGPEPQIRQYTVPKLAVSSDSSHGTNAVSPLGPGSQQAGTGQPRSMLGAIVLAGDSAWFFKATAEPSVIEAHRDAIKKFLRTIAFSADGKPPRWDLPDGWKQSPGDTFRFATLEIGDSEPPLELSISRLSRSENDKSLVLQNVNRWRGQLQLPEASTEQLEKDAERFSIGEFPCTLVELTGAGSGAMGGPFSGGASGIGPFAGGGLPKDHPPLEKNAKGSVAGPAPGATAGNITYEVPEGWKEKPAGGLRAASFEVVSGDQKLDISVIPLSLNGPAGDVVENVNRWRGQLGLSPQSAEEVAQELRKLEGQAMKWQVVELAGENPAVGPQTMLGAIGKSPSAAWFVKLTGPPALVALEKEHFDQFVRSLQVK